MGCWYELKVGSTRVSYGKNYFDGGLLVPFQRGDLRVRPLDENEGELRFDAPARVVARRLDLLGFTLARAAAEYSQALETARDEFGKFGEYDWPATMAEWQQTVASRAVRIHAAELDAGWSVERMVWEDTMFGFPGGHFWNVVRALVDAHPDDSVSLDLTEMVRGGYLAEDGSDLSPEGSREPLIILTEGKSDAHLLRAAIDTLFPDYSEFIRFIDYDFAKAAGGVAEVVRFVKMFAGSGIKNRVVAMFDNDAAGHQACSELGRLPPNVFAMCLPPMDLFRSYPTLGPDGQGVGSIDGTACSIELYLGRDALADAVGNLRPVRWTGFNEKMSRYQGEVSDKAAVQKRFEDLLGRVREAPDDRAKFDFSGIEAIFERVVAALTTR